MTVTRAAVKVVGMVAGERQHVVAYASEGDPVLVRPEPDNPYDRNAIAVYTAPRSALLHPNALVSSVTDPARVGYVHPDDRVLLLDRQAGYVPAGFAATVTLPPEGIIGWVSGLRWTPPEYDYVEGAMVDPRVAGFDVTAWWPRGFVQVPVVDPGGYE